MKKRHEGRIVGRWRIEEDELLILVRERNESRSKEEKRGKRPEKRRRSKRRLIHGRKGLQTIRIMP